MVLLIYLCPSPFAHELDDLFQGGSRAKDLFDPYLFEFRDIVRGYGAPEKHHLLLQTLFPEGGNYVWG